jgi:hypothetical protein
MRGVLRMQLWLAVGGLVCAASAQAAEPAGPAFTPVAHSSLVRLEAARTQGGLELRLRSVKDDAAVAVTALTVSIDGRSVAATAAPDGSWSVPWPGNTAAAQGTLEVVIAHDGIREVLSGPLPGSAGGTGNGGPAGASAGGLRDHKQLAWWILNIGIVLIAVLAISRRMS